MTSCAYCGRPATTRIVSNPEEVCVEHAAEFWRGLLVCAAHPMEPCVKYERLCTCRLCEELSACYQRTVAIAVSGRSPARDEHFPVRLAS
jgi:hypothetical protein